MKTCVAHHQLCCPYATGSLRACGPITSNDCTLFSYIKCTVSCDVQSCPVVSRRVPSCPVVPRRVPSCPVVSSVQCPVWLVVLQAAEGRASEGRGSEAAPAVGQEQARHNAGGGAGTGNGGRQRPQQHQGMCKITKTKTITASFVVNWIWRLCYSVHVLW